MPNLNFLSTPASNILPIKEYSADTASSPLNPADDEFDSVNFPVETELDTTGIRFPLAIPWEWLNQGAALAVLATGSVVLSTPDSSSEDVKIILQGDVGGDFKFRMKVNSIGWDLATSADMGFIVKSVGSSKMFLLGLTAEAGVWNFSGKYFESPVSFGGFTSTILANPYIPAAGALLISFPFYLELQNTGGILFFRYSPSGISGTFFDIASEPVGDHIGVAELVGIGLNSANNAPAFCSVDWFRRML